MRDNTTRYSGVRTASSSQQLAEVRTNNNILSMSVSVCMANRTCRISNEYSVVK